MTNNAPNSTTIWAGRPEDHLRSLPTPGGKRYVETFAHGTLLVELYAPRGRDPQQPHDRDEVYVVTHGTGTFVTGHPGAETRVAFAPGDLLFVPAHLPHRFEDFTEDFATWVMFYGPEGGEAP